MSIYMHAITQRLYPSTVCVYSIPSAPSYPCVYVRAYPPYYVLALLILLFCHPTMLCTRYYLSISMFPSLLSVLSCLSSRALERLASLASLAYCDYLHVLSSVSQCCQLSLWCDVACSHGSLIEDNVCVCLLVYGKWCKCPQRRAHSGVLQS
jgi:hypothetical protein